MQAVLIPFLLAANLSQNNDATWEHGALTKWKAYVNLHGENNLRSLFTLNGNFDLECTTKDEASVLCRALNFDLVSEMSHEVIPERMSRSVSGSVPIEIKFSNHGIEEIAIPKGMRKGAMVLIKKMASLFNVGVDLNEKKDQFPMFVTAASGTLGECTSNYSVIEENEDFVFPADTPRHHRDYELFLIPHPERQDRHVMTLVKNIDAMECDKNGQYFNDHMDMTDIPADSKLHSIQIKIGDHGYFYITGVADEHYTLEEKNGVNQFNVTETLILSLEDIEEAKEPLSEIEDPKTFSLLLNDLGEQGAPVASP